MAGQFKISDDYVDVAERIREFSDKYPEGSLQSEWGIHTIGDKTFIVCDALAYRTPDDPRPGQGLAWEPFPGPTPFTRDSELMNSQTSAWGRAIVALGFQTKKIASKQEVQNRSGADDGSGDRPKAGAPEAPSGGVPADTNGHDPKFITPGQKGQVGRLWAIARANNVEEERVREIVMNIAGVDSTAKITVDKYDDICHAIQFDEVPFR